ncbi:MAG: TIM barrel protein [Candidatus ainarchaeum sp.]|nr:TIM barrel protein [Candidatus ainarchaeum sp.]
MGLSSSYFAFQNFSVYDSVKRISDLGFSTVELGAAHSFEKGISQTLRKIKKDFPKMNFTVHGMFPPLKEHHWFNLSLGISKKNKKIFSDMFKAAELVEAMCVTVHPGYLSKAIFRNKMGMDCEKEGSPISKEKALRGVCSAIDFAMQLSEKTGIGFGIENVPQIVFKPAIYSAKDFQLLFAKFSKAGLLFDMGHALAETRLGEILSFKKKIIEMHVHYSRPKQGAPRRDEHLPLPSEEAIAFMKTIPQIKKIPLIFEHGTSTSEQQILEEKKLLENFLKKI